jgi:uncharacterized alkaline shock family protein YloU
MAENGSIRPPGKTTIAPNVLLTIARLTTLNVKGVTQMSQLPGGVNRVFDRGYEEGVRIRVDGDQVSADLFVILDHESNVREVSRTIQHDVSRAISEMVGMEVGQINVHIEDIYYPPELDIEE